MAFAKIAAFFKSTAGRAMNNGTMIATSKGFAEMIYADGVVEDAELKAAYEIFKRNPKLSVFGSEAVKQLDTSLDLWETSKRQARVETSRALESWVKTATKEDKEDFLLSVLDLMDSDGDQDDAEMAVAQKYATLTGLNLKDFL